MPGREAQPLLVLLQGAAEVVAKPSVRSHRAPGIPPGGLGRARRPSPPPAGPAPPARASGVLLAYRSELAVRDSRPRLRKVRDPAPRPARRSRAPCAGWEDRVPPCRSTLPRPSGRRRRRRGSAWASRRAASPRRAPSATPSACATFVAMSDCTWKTSVSAASNGCCHFEVGAPDARISTSSGLTCTRFAASALLPAHGGRQEVVRVELPRDLPAASSSSSCRASSCRARSPRGPAARSACRAPRPRCRRRSSRPRERPGSRTAARPRA